MCFPAAAAAAAAVDADGGVWVPVMSPFAFSPATATYTSLASTTMPAIVADGEPTTATMPAPMTFSALPQVAARPVNSNVVVRSVWARNLREEADLIASLVPRFRYAAVDTEFPGTVYRPLVPAYALSDEKRYALLKANVDELHLIQLGLTLFDADGRLPDLSTGGAVQYVWEFNFREFDVRRHRHAPESITMLRTKGVDFARTRREGVDAAAFGPRLRKWLRGGLGAAGVVTFSGAYDVAYLVKMMFGRGYQLPVTAAEFDSVVKSVLQKTTLYDVKEMARHCSSVDLRGGLDRVAGKLDVPRSVGEAHQAGSDSLLTCHTFIKMREQYFDDDDLATFAGVVSGIKAPDLTRSSLNIFL